ncbi:MAG: GldM family protein [Chitinophagales bacterium]
MRSILHLTFTLLITLFAVHQTYQLQQIKKTHPVKASIESGCDSKAVIEVDRTNVLFAGIENFISVRLANVPIENLEVSFSGEVTSQGNGDFALKPDKIGLHRISVKGENRQGELCQFERMFIVKHLPVIIGIGSKSGGKIWAGDMRSQRVLTAIITGVGIDGRLPIVSFHISLFREGAAIQRIYNEGETFTDASLQLVQQAQTGDFYFFSDIKVKNIDGSIRTLDNMLFEIK